MMWFSSYRLKERVQFVEYKGPPPGIGGPLITCPVQAHSPYYFSIQQVIHENQVNE